VGALIELRVLDGANIYFTRPAVKLTLQVGALAALSEADARGVAERAGLGGRTRPGPADTEQRRRFAMRLAAHLTRTVAGLAGVQRLSVRTRAGDSPDAIVVVFPWRRRGRATALGEQVAALLDAVCAADLAERIATAGAVVGASDEGDPPRVPRPSIPVVAVTGTNGKTTTSRLIAHVARAAGHVAGWSSTDGVYLDGVLVDAGDWSGFGGAGRVLRERSVTFAVLESARGGILLRGLGATHNDVAVVTNVQADHLGLHGIHTLDQLAEVKAAIVRITKPTGWVVLNADDPRVMEMRRLSRARPFAFSLDPDSPGLRVAVEAGGRGITVLDGDVVVVSHDSDPAHLLPVAEVPLTLAGLSPHNTANALAAAAACLAVGLPRSAVLEGLRSFVPDATLNPGRMNLFDVAGVVVVVDLAHNEDGLRALLQVARGVCPQGSAVRLVLGTAGDRTDELIRSLGEIAARGADDVVIGHKAHYLRDRTMEQMTELFLAGLRGAAWTAAVPVHDTELGALQAVHASSRPGDVCAVMSHAERAAIYAWLGAQGAVELGPGDVRRLAAQAGGGSET
jgi:cyanophycin synthetase